MNVNSFFFLKFLFVHFLSLNLWDVFAVSIYLFMCVKSEQIEIIFIPDVQRTCFGK